MANDGAPRRKAARDAAGRCSAERRGLLLHGLDEQKGRNLEHNDRVAVTTGDNAWASGIDVVVEGAAVRVSDDETLRRLAAAWEAKYGSVWHFDVADGMFRHSDGGGAAVFRVEPAKVLAFAKDPHGQTTYRFGR